MPSDISSEKELLLQRAEQLGIEANSKMSVERLRSLVNETLTEPEKKEEEVAKPFNISEYRKNKTKLVRISIRNLDPADADKKGEFFTVSNKFLGTITKFIPYQSPAADAYHVPECLLSLLKNKRYTSNSYVKDGATKTRIVSTSVPKFSIQILPPLTKRELAELKQRQLATNSES